MPVGVQAETLTISGPSSRVQAAGARYFPVGQTERGPTDRAILIRSLAEYEYYYGARVAYGALHDDLRVYFNEGGGEAYVGRTVGPAAIKAIRTLNDRAGAPLPTIDIQAKDAGAWGNALTVQVADATGTNFRITIAGTPDGLSEVFDELTDPADAVARINAGSRWVTAINRASATAPPANRPAVLAATALATGTDDRAAIVTQNYLDTANNLFPQALGDGAVAIPGQPSSAVGAGLIAHSKATNRVAILTTVAAQTPTQAKAAATALKGADGRFAGLAYPWVKFVADGAERTVAPTSKVAADRAKAINADGPWRAGAGEIAVATFLTGLERELTKAESDDLNDNGVIPIRPVARSIRTYGWRSLSNDPGNYLFLTYQDTINRIVTELLAALEAYVELPIDGDGRLFGRVHGDALGIVVPMRAAGGLYPLRDRVTGGELDPGYKVDTGPGVNTIDSIGRGEIRCSVGARVSPTGELVKVTVSKVALTAPL